MTAPHPARRPPLATLVIGVVVVVLLGAGVAAAATRHRAKTAPSARPPAGTAAPTTAPGGPPPAPPARSEPAYITAIKAQVAELRGLAWKAPLTVDVVSKAELARRYREGTQRDARPDRLAGDGDTFTVLHLIPSGLDYAKTVEDLFSGLILGFYDPKTKELVVGDSGGEVDGNTKVTLAHELDHALTDQWFDFGSRTDALDQADRQEELDAFDALIEGDAKLMESRFADKFLTDEEQLANALGGLGGADDSAAAKVAKTPKFLLDYLYFPYTHGLDFVKAQAGGRGFAGVDDAYRRPPTSTEQILHPDLYAAGQAEAPPALPDLGPTGCDVRRRGALGEFKMSEVLAERLDAASADAAASGWNGDSFATLRCGNALGLVERWQADSEAAATRLAAALARWAPGWSKSSSAAGGRFSGSGGSGRIVRTGARVDLVLADDGPTADRLAALL